MSKKQREKVIDELEWMETAGTMREKALLPTGLKHDPAVVFTYVEPTRSSILTSVKYKKVLY